MVPAAPSTIRPKTVSFDVGGVIDREPAKFGLLMAALRRRSVRVIVVTALSYREDFGVHDLATLRAFAAGRLYGMGLTVGGNYDACYAVPELPDARLTGVEKSIVLGSEAARLHVDDDAAVAAGISACPVHIFDGDLFAVERAIGTVLGAAE